MSEKTYVFDNDGGGCNGNAAFLASLMGRNNQDPMAMAAMMNGGMNNQWNNPFIYLVWMMFAQRFFGNGWNGENGCNNPQIEALREQMNTNQNSGLLMDAIKGNNAAINQLAGQLNCDFNTLNSAICDVRGGIDRLAGQVGFSAERVINAVQAGDCNLASRIQECCCENRLAICQQTNTLQNAINFVNSSVERGFSASSYETQRQTCDIINAMNAGFNAIKQREDAREIQQLRDEKQQYQISALLQQQSSNIINTVRPCPVPAFVTCNPWSTCGCGYGNGYNNYGGCNNGCGSGCGC